MTDWSDLKRELDAWGAADKHATLWWRDDDAVSPTPELERLLRLSSSTATPIALAVIPRHAEPSLRRMLAGRKGVSVLQHGYAHSNHCRKGKKSEFCAGREARIMLDDLVRGRDQLDDYDHRLPGLVPPWNRISPDLLPELPGIGLTAISAFAPRRAAEPAPGLRCTNTHVDPVNWRGDRGFLGVEACLNTLVGHLSARRLNQVDADEPTGLLTHHQIADEEGWEFLGDLLRRTQGHPAARWLDGRQALWPETPS